MIQPKKTTQNKDNVNGNPNGQTRQEETRSNAIKDTMIKYES